MDISKYATRKKDNFIKGVDCAKTQYILHKHIIVIYYYFVQNH